MPKNRAKKRKKGNSSTGSAHSDDCSDNSDLSSDHGVQPLSAVLKKANDVIYEASDEFADRSEARTANNFDQEAETSCTVPNNVVTDIFHQIKGTNRKIDGVLIKLNKLDLIESRMTSMETAISEFRSRVINVETKTRSLQESVEVVNKKCADVQIQKDQIRKLENDLKEQKCAITEIRKGINMVKNESDSVRDLEEKVTDLRCRSMKQNLIFTGLSNESRSEDTETKLRDFLYEQLEIDGHIEFGNVHRFGRFVRGRDRPIVARFLYHNDMLNVKHNAYKLKGTRYGISEQFPQEVENRRKQLYPVMKRHKNAGDKVTLVRDRLYINNELYIAQNEQPAHVRQQPQSYRDAVMSDSTERRLSDSVHHRSPTQVTQPPTVNQRTRTPEVIRRPSSVSDNFAPGQQNTSSPLNPLASA
ncbi:hypothetical protein FSP39_001358 [Pinctada imbricata]|uniref:Uncharacterized protein n=1 Tax=Pinctada imbricata TaxID=66713 RepID=A0AA88XUK5_PINIB|nr:hypothetical protein FSP39_001358 [Pinctada imbricata]